VHKTWALGSGRVDGVLGLQAESSRFSALGEEAFVPSTQTRSSAVFALQRWAWGGGPTTNTASSDNHVSAGLRAERVQVQSSGDAEPAASDATGQFGPAQTRRFNPRSASLAVVLKPSAQWQATASFSHTERAPTFYELYANGLHAATGAFERGSTQQALERGQNADVSVAWRSGDHHLRLGLFSSRFSNYIALVATSEPNFVGDEGNSAPVFAFQGVKAKLQGLELEGSWQLLRGSHSLALHGKLDLVRGTNTTAKEPLPRLPPLQTTWGLTWAHGAWQLAAEAQHAAAQKRVPATDKPTASYTLVNLQAQLALDGSGVAGLGTGTGNLLLFAKLNNAGNTLAYSATTVGTVRPLAPLPGRSLQLGVRASF
jgi:iron complex outermembrane recepter protein